MLKVQLYFFFWGGGPVVHEGWHPPPPPHHSLESEGTYYAYSLSPETPYLRRQLTEIKMPHILRSLLSFVLQGTPLFQAFSGKIFPRPMPQKYPLSEILKTLHGPQNKEVFYSCHVSDLRFLFIKMIIHIFDCSSRLPWVTVLRRRGRMWSTCRLLPSLWIRIQPGWYLSHFMIS